MTTEDYMRAALEQATLGAAAGEVPIGAVLVVNDRIICETFNQPIGSIDPTAHAEVLVLREAARALGNYRLTDATVYVTIEPCLMCVGALVHARVRDVVFGATEPKTGALVSAVRALEQPGLNHRFGVTGGLLELECRSMIQKFFWDKRRSERVDIEL
jgi:tRNA(adenine34) deaminase